MKHDYKCIRQVEETDCGAACLSTVCAYYGREVDIFDIRSLAKVDRYGANMLGLYRAAEKLGFDPEGLSGSVRDFLSEELTLPCIAHVIIDGQLEHYVVIFEIVDQSTMIVGDPARGCCTYSVSEFESIWTGHVLTLRPNAHFETGLRKKRTFLPFFKTAGKHKGKIAIVALLSLCATLLSVGASFFNYYLIDVIIPNKSMNSLTLLAAAIIIGYIIILLVNLIRAKIIANVSKDISTDLMCQYVGHLLNIKYDFYNQHTSGDMISRLQDSNIVREAISKIVMTTAFDIVMATVCLIVLANLNLSLFALVILIVGTYAFSVAKFSDKINRASEDLRNKDAVASTTFFETVRGIETIKSYEYEENTYHKNAETLSDLMDSDKVLSLILSKQTYLSESVIVIGEVLILTVGGVGVIGGKISLGVLFMFYSLLNMSLLPIKNIVELFPVVEKARVSAKRLNTVFAHPCEEKEAANTGTLAGSIVIRHLSFRYGERDLVFDDFSLNVSEREKIALVGDSGSGKSTLVKIILRLYDVEKGEIYIGDTPLEHIPITELRARIAYVPQNPYIFRGSLLDNIRVGNIGLTEEETMDRLNETPFRHFIERLPMGYASIITEGGENLSGGQRQMIAIARALIKRGDILIMDEAYSSIDAGLKKIARDSIDLAYENTTRIVITHDMAEAQACDRIVMMHAGSDETVKRELTNFE